MKTNDLTVFVKTAESLNFSVTARALNMTPAQVSDSIKRLENDLKVTLFIRSTRKMRVSREGLNYLPYATKILETLNEGQQALSGNSTDTPMKLNLSLPSDVGRNVMLPWIREFQEQHPNILFNLNIGDDFINFYKLNVEISIRYGNLADSTLISIPLVPNNRRIICASPSYIHKNGMPSSPQELRQHNCLRYTVGKQSHDRWAVHLPHGIETIKVDGDFISNDADIIHRLALDGTGIIYKSHIDIVDDLRSGRLIEIFPREYGEPNPLQLVCANRSSLNTTIYLLHKFLVQKFDHLLLQP